MPKKPSSFFRQSQLLKKDDSHDDKEFDLKDLGDVDASSSESNEVLNEKDNGQLKPRDITDFSSKHKTKSQS
eukprot:CAMPEP_0170553030 /NCGR_PEP_ID=MMETSP0211-20121228/10905_1 /TAXON_ID=311385 /ORGANISM="Pseudokeronopsis sp., Strain OXSARD2" /LENGTH=71 /DNA_ID=CAMNT_0010861147 /DNA_START=71 /DNA_END=286 /DNA_ORIENTATION=+